MRRIGLTYLLLAVVLAGFLLLPPAETAAQNRRHTHIAAVHSGRCMEVKGKSKKDKAPIQQFRCKKRKGANQRWHIVSAGGGSYYFVNHNSGKCLDVKGKSTKDGAQLQQYKCTGGSHQLFKLSPSHSPANQMQAQHSGKCVEVRGASRSDRAQIQQGGCSGAPNQAWLMQ